MAAARSNGCANNACSRKMSATNCFPKPWNQPRERDRTTASSYDGPPCADGRSVGAESRPAYAHALPGNLPDAGLSSTLAPVAGGMEGVGGRRGGDGNLVFPRTRSFPFAGGIGPARMVAGESREKTK